MLSLARLFDAVTAKRGILKPYWFDSLMPMAKQKKTRNGFYRYGHNK